MTARALLTRALRTVGVLAGNETPSAEDASAALGILTSMLDAWRADRLTITHLTRNAFTATSGQASFTIGPTGADWTFGSVPTWIDAASVILVGSNPAVEQPIEILTQQRWALLQLKDLSYDPAYGIYYERTSASLGTVRVLAVPDQTQTIVLYLLAPLTATLTLDTGLDLPSGYEDALVYNVAKRAALEWSRPLDPLLAELADNSLRLIKSANVQPTELVTDRALWEQPWRGSSRAAFLRGYW